MLPSSRASQHLVRLVSSHVRTYATKNQKQSPDLSCTCSAFDKACNRLRTAALLLRSCFASCLCDCVGFVCVWLRVCFGAFVCRRYASLLFFFAVLLSVYLHSSLLESCGCHHTLILAHDLPRLN